MQFHDKWKRSVPSLENLAFEVSFMEIISNLALCRDHRPQHSSESYKEVDWVSSSSFLSTHPFMSSENVLKFVTSRLNKYLVGVMSNKIRAKYAERFSRLLGYSSDVLQIIPEIWAFLESILDDNFLELETHISLPKMDPNSQIIATIASCSPLLQKLKINFQGLRDKKKEGMVEKLKPVIVSLNSLDHLTSLNLHNMHKCYRPILGFLGKLKLSHLCLGGFGIEKQDILAIMLGELMNHLPNSEEGIAWKRDQLLQCLEIPSEYLTPVCSTLNHFAVGELAPADYMDNKWKISGSTVAFVLRHMPVLQKMEECEFLSKSIKILYNSSNPGLWAQYENAFRRAARLSTGTSAIPLPAFSGTLALTHLDFVTLLHPDLLNIIGSTCPSLKEVTFGRDETKYREEDSDEDYFATDRYAVPVMTITPETLENILMKWPKLETVTIWQVMPEYVKSILNVFGPTLKQLTLEHCSNINFSDLASCKQLESLRIRNSSLANPQENEALLMDPDLSFLPQLKKFKSGICLGVYSRLFEGKTSLTHLTLRCCHIGTEVSAGLDWHRIPVLWSRMELLRIKQCSDSLTVSMLSDVIIPRISSLKEVQMPEKMGKKEEELAHSMIEMFKCNWPRVQLDFGSFLHGYDYYDDCSFLKKPRL